jgi:succinyl-CoA synthetase beta subunit/citryl-CoA synthetase large subunit
MARLLESDALRILRQAEIPTPQFEVVSTPQGTKEATSRLGLPVVIKPLIPVGGRGKVRAIRVAHSAEEALRAAESLLGKTVLNFPVREVLVSEGLKIAKEFFASFTFDSMSRSPVLLLSGLGGIDVEESIDQDHGRLIEKTIEITVGLRNFEAREIAERAGLEDKLLLDTANALTRLYRIFRDVEAQTVEVNPLIMTDEGRLVAPTAVIVLDDQALFRHPELEEIADGETTNGWRPLTELEKEMRVIDQTDSGSAIRFNEFETGDIAFMVTGGGAGLLALDAIRKLGGKPATTFDITPGKVEEKMYLATKAILSRPGLKGLIAGGNITNFIPIDVKVRGVMRALIELKVDPKKFPIVFRFAGPGVEVAKRLAAQLPGIEFYDASTSIENAVRRIVDLTTDR